MAARLPGHPTSSLSKVSPTVQYPSGVNSNVGGLRGRNFSASSASDSATKAKEISRADFAKRRHAYDDVAAELKDVRLLQKSDRAFLSSQIRMLTDDPTLDPENERFNFTVFAKALRENSTFTPFWPENLDILLAPRPYVLTRSMWQQSVDECKARVSEFYQAKGRTSDYVKMRENQVELISKEIKRITDDPTFDLKSGKFNFTAFANALNSNPSFAAFRFVFGDDLVELRLDHFDFLPNLGSDSPLADSKRQSSL